jgi:dehydrogenase/reductase SDR family protein 4
MRRFEGKVCVVTASTAGIGLAIASRLATEGGRVVVSSRKQQAVDEAVAQLQGLPGVRAADIAGRTCHVDKGEDRAAVLRLAKERFGSVDVLVLNAAVSTFVGALMDTPESHWEKMFRTNVKSTFLFAQEALPFLSTGSFPTKPGAFAPNILLVGSIAGYMPEAPIGAYAVTKTTMIGMCKGMAKELAAKGIRVNLLAPGLIRTAFAAPLVESAESGAKQEEQMFPAGASPLGRVGEPGEMAGVASFLCSADASYVSGECVIAAGGSARL